MQTHTPDIRSTPPKLSCAYENSSVFRPLRCKSEMILRGTVIPCVDGDLEIIAVPLMKEDDSIWLVSIWGPQTAALGTLPTVVQNMCIRAMTLRYRSEGWGWGLTSQASWICIPTTAPQT
jgi:hypothetical protein